MKTQILAAIGEAGLQPLAYRNAALAANVRIKSGFSPLQMATAHAAHPEQPVAALKRERAGCGIADPDLDSTVAGARMAGKSCRVPGARRIMAHIADDMRVMAAPLLTETPNGLVARLDGLLAALPVVADDLLDPVAVAARMHAAHGGVDSLHQLVMDLHKRLNARQATLGEETLDGVPACNLAQADRLFVSAFKRLSAAGTPAILVRRDTVTTDIEGMALAAGTLTASGGRTSHAAVVASQLRKVCLVAIASWRHAAAA